jgi:Holliday junction resolvase RusA-like endonuclease
MEFFRRDLHRCDLDNLSKAVLDAMQGVAYEDDTDVVRLELGKTWSQTRPGVQVCVDVLI